MAKVGICDCTHSTFLIVSKPRQKSQVAKEFISKASSTRVEVAAPELSDYHRAVVHEVGPTATDECPQGFRAVAALLSIQMLHSSSCSQLLHPAGNRLFASAAASIARPARQRRS